MTAVISVCIKKNFSKLLNFCVAILILKMEEDTQYFWCIMLYYFKKGKNKTETQKKDLYSLWRRCCDWSNISKVAREVLCWRFLAGQCSTVDSTGRPVEVDSDQIGTLIENNQHYTM